jgi:hypothetical protein
VCVRFACRPPGSGVPAFSRIRRADERGRIDEAAQLRGEVVDRAARRARRGDFRVRARPQ